MGYQDSRRYRERGGIRAAGAGSGRDRAETFPAEDYILFLKVVGEMSSKLTGDQISKVVSLQ